MILAVLMAVAGWTVPAIRTLPAAFVLSQMPAVVWLLAALTQWASEVDWSRPRIRSYRPPAPVEPAAADDLAERRERKRAA